MRDLGTFDPDSELYTLRLDMLIARARWPYNRQAQAAYLLPGREEWG